MDVHFFYWLLRQIIYDNSEHLELLDGEVEVDESYFGGRRKGKHGKGAAGKAPVFDLLKRNDKVFTVIVPQCQGQYVNADYSATSKTG